MWTKEKIIETINQLPKRFSIDDLLEEIILIEKVEKGLAQAKSGKIISDKLLEKKLAKWFD